MPRKDEVMACANCGARDVPLMVKCRSIRMDGTVRVTRWCRPCNRSAQAAYFSTPEGRERLKANARLWYASNREKVLAKAAASRRGGNRTGRVGRPIAEAVKAV